MPGKYSKLNKYYKLLGEKRHNFSLIDSSSPSTLSSDLSSTEMKKNNDKKFSAEKFTDFRPS